MSVTIEDQYYISAVHEKGGSVEESVQQFFSPKIPFVNWKNIQERELNLTLMIHAPHSMIHMERGGSSAVRGRKYLPVKKEDGSVCTVGPGDEPLVIPETRAVAGKELDSLLVDYLKKLPVENKAVIKEIIGQLGNNGVNYGSFYPAHLGEIPSDQTIDPAKFVTLYLLKLSSEQRQHNHAGRLITIFHPDILFFLGKGDPKEISAKAVLLDRLSKSLGVEVFYENVVFGNPVFSEANKWMMDPVKLRDLLPKDSENSGVCIDISHLQRLGYSNEFILNTVKFLGQTGRAAVHSRKGNSIEADETGALLEAYKMGLPIAYEPN